MANTKCSIDIGKLASKPRFNVPEVTSRDILCYDTSKPFGSDAKPITIQGKAKFKPLNMNPSPTSYEPNYSQVKPKSNNINMLTSKS